MYAIRLHEFGPAENLGYEEVPDPEPAESEVRIRVAAAGVHNLDTALRTGDTGGAPMALPELPTIPGREVAGTVDAVGPGADESWLGRRVVAHLGVAPGGYAELAVTAQTALFGVPDGLGAEQAIALVGTGRTAAGILEAAALTADDVVLVPAAAGGLGHLFVQDAKHVGATVIGLAGGPDKVERVRALGADLALDYLRPDWPAQVVSSYGVDPVTVVLDGVGGEPGRASLELLGTGGRHLLFGWSAGAATEIGTADIVAKSLTVSWPLSPFRGRIPDLVRIALDRGATGRWRPVTTTFPLAKAADAHRALADRGTIGKTVLIP